MTTREALHELIDQLPEEDLEWAAESLSGITVERLDEILAAAPYDDEPFTEKQRARANAAIEKFPREGGGYTTEQVRRIIDSAL